MRGSLERATTLAWSPTFGSMDHRSRSRGEKVKNLVFIYSFRERSIVVGQLKSVKHKNNCHENRANKNHSSGQMLHDSNLKIPFIMYRISA